MAKLTDKQTIALQAELIDLQATLLDPTQALLASTLGGSLAEKSATIVKQAKARIGEITEMLNS